MAPVTVRVTAPLAILANIQPSQTRQPTFGRSIRIVAMASLPVRCIPARQAFHRLAEVINRCVQFNIEHLAKKRSF